MAALSGLLAKGTVDMEGKPGAEPKARSFQAFVSSNHGLTISLVCDVPIKQPANQSVID